MKRLLFALAFLLLGSPLYAQTIVHAEWQAPAAVNPPVVVTGYTWQLDNGAVTTIPATLDATCNCFRSDAGQIAANDTSAHTYIVKAQSTATSTGITPPITSTVSGAPLNMVFSIGPTVITVGTPTAGKVVVGP